MKNDTIKAGDLVMAIYNSDVNVVTYGAQAETEMLHAEDKMIVYFERPGTLYKFRVMVGSLNDKTGEVSGQIIEMNTDGRLASLCFRAAANTLANVLHASEFTEIDQ